MLWRKRAVVEPLSSERLVWLGQKSEGNQWMDPDFYSVWVHAMEAAFDILGMAERYRTWKDEEKRTNIDSTTGPKGLVPVTGWKNRNVLRRATENLTKVTASFEIVPVPSGTALQFKGEKKKAMEEWSAIVELLGETTVVAIVTPGLEYYVQGTQIGYDRATRHLFKRGNTLERLGTPADPIWRANVSGYGITIVGDWDEIKKTRQETGLNIFQMLQLRLNAELGEAVKQGS